MTIEGDDRLLPNSPAAAAAILVGLERDRARAAAALEPDAGLLYATWGAAWSVGFGLMFAARWPSSPVEVPLDVAGAVFGLLLAAAVVVTAVHLDDRFQGVPGRRVGRCEFVKGVQDRRSHPTSNRGGSTWTPTWTPSRPHCTSGPTTC